MRWRLAAFCISMVAFGAQAQASDDLPLSTAGLAPLVDAMLALTTGGEAAALQLGAATEANAQSVDLTATSSLQASISHFSLRQASVLTTGNLSLGTVSGATGGMTSLQLSTGINNIQQNSVALAFAL
jgi:hypothetical protein